MELTDIFSNLRTQLIELEKLTKEDYLEEKEKNQIKTILNNVSSILNLKFKENENSQNLDKLKNYLKNKGLLKNENLEKHLAYIILDLNLLIKNIKKDKNLKNVSNELTNFFREIEFIIDLNEEERNEFSNISNLDRSNNLTKKDMPENFINFLKNCMFDDTLLNHKYFPFKELFQIRKIIEEGGYYIFDLGLNPIIENTINKLNKEEFLEFMNILKEIANNTKNGGIYLWMDGLKPIIENTINKFENKKEFLEFMNISKDIINKNLSKIKKKENYKNYFKSIYLIIKIIILDLNQVNNKEKQQSIIKFYNKQVRNSKSNVITILKLEQFLGNRRLSHILMFYLEYKQRSLIKFINSISVIKEINLDFEIEEVGKHIIPLTSFSKERLKNFLKIDKSQIISYYEKLLNEYSKNNSTRRFFSIFSKNINVEQMKNIFSKHMTFLKTNLENNNNEYLKNSKKLTELFCEVLLNKFDRILSNKIENKFMSEFNLENIDLTLIDTNFLEIYKMYSSNRLKFNKTQAEELLNNYLQNKCYPQNNNKNLLNTYPYNLKNNQNWFNQIGIDKNFFEENSKEFEIEGELSKEEIEREIKKYFDESNEILEKNNGTEKQETYKKLLFYFSQIKNENFENEENYNLLKTQIVGINNLLNSKKNDICKIVIKKEIDVIKIIGLERVINGCYNFSSNNGAFYFMFNIGIDMNNLLYRIYDLNENVLGEIHCCFTTNNNLVRFKLYRSFKSPNINLDKYFNIYIKELAKKYGVKLINSGKEEKFIELNCEKWHNDWSCSFDTIEKI
jgi:hypothetical protein